MRCNAYRCKVEFVPRSYTQRYCSRDCRNRAKHAKSHVIIETPPAVIKPATYYACATCDHWTPDERSDTLGVCSREVFRSCRPWDQKNHHQRKGP